MEQDYNLEISSHDEFENNLPAPLSITRARHRIKLAQAEAEKAMGELTALMQGNKLPLCQLAVDALICGCLSEDLPLSPDNPKVSHLRENLAGRITKVEISIGLDVLEDQLTTFRIALSALQVMSALDEPIPGSWSNLPTILLARKLNVAGQAQLKGRIPGGVL